MASPVYLGQLVWVLSCEPLWASIRGSEGLSGQMLQSVNGVGHTQPLSLSNLHLHSRLEALSRVLARRLRSALLVTRVPTSAALPGATSGPGSWTIIARAHARAPPGGCAGAEGRGWGQRERVAGHAHSQVASSPERLRAGAGPRGRSLSRARPHVSQVPAPQALCL